MVQNLVSSIAALTVTFFAIRGSDTFSLLFVAGVVWAVAAVFMGAAFHLRPQTMLSNRIWVGIGLASLLTASVVFTRWPIRLGPVLYHSEFRALADSVAAGHSFTSPRQIGPFTFQQGQVERGFVCLWTDLDPKGRSGFIRGVATSGIPFNAWSVAATGSEWHFLIED